MFQSNQTHSNDPIQWSNQSAPKQVPACNLKIFYVHFKMADICLLIILNNLLLFQIQKRQTFKIKHCFTVWLQQ